MKLCCSMPPLCICDDVLEITALQRLGNVLSSSIYNMTPANAILNTQHKGLHIHIIWTPMILKELARYTYIMEHPVWPVVCVIISAEYHVISTDISHMNTFKYNIS